MSIPSTFDDETRNRIVETFRNIEIDHLLVWKRHEQKFSIDDLEFDRYIEQIVNFVNDYLVHPLSTGSVPISNPSEVHRREEKIDRYWALVMRTLGRRFLKLERDRFPEALCGIYLSKYAEMVADTVVKLIHKFNEFSGLYNEHRELVEAVQRKLAEIFCGNDISVEPFDKQLRNVANKSYSLDVGLDDLEHQYDIANARREALDQLTGVPRQCGVIGDEDGCLNGEETYECGVLVGEIQALSRRLIEFPKSMMFIGLGAKRVASVHGVDS